jgi:hypothetical protein
VSTISTVPPVLELAISETRIWPLDLSPTLTAMGVSGPSSPTVTCIDPVTGGSVSGVVTATSLSGNVITATLTGALLTLNKSYEIRWTAVVGGQTLVWLTQLNVVGP